jgi:Family of unknown function (DUF5995)
MLRTRNGWMLFAALLFSCAGYAQNNDRAYALLGRLDSIRNSPSVSRHFADIYFETTIHAVNFFSASDTRIQHLMSRMENRFADYFFRSVHAHENSLAMPDEWRAYYSDKDAPALRYILFGVNAHINGDIWQALTSEFSREELKELKPHYFLYYKELLKEYRMIYDEALKANPRIRLLHHLSFGLDELFGKLMLKRWRKRQIRLAELYFADKPLFEKELNKLHRKRNRLDHLIRKNI